MNAHVRRLKRDERAAATSRVVVLESTALISLLSHSRHSAKPLRALLEKKGEAGRPWLDRLVIPDQVFYEVTGIMPGAQAEMLAAFQQARSQGGNALMETIERYVRSSPRSGNASARRPELQQEVREMLRFVADYPDCLMPTTTGLRCDAKSLADHTMLSSSPDLLSLESYRPSFADVRGSVAGPVLENVPLHLRQLYLWGLFDRPGEDAFPRDYLKLAEKHETANTVKRRFVTIGAFLDLMALKGQAAPPGWQASFLPSAPLTPAFLRAYPQLLPPVPERLRAEGRAAHYTPEEALALSKPNLAQWQAMGLLPHGEAAERLFARAFGFDYPPCGGEVHLGEDERWRQRGLLEYIPTVGDLNRLSAHLPLSPQKDALEALLSHLPTRAASAHRERFRTECQPPRLMQMGRGEEPKVPFIGVPYEKAFSEALISGMISWKEFMEIAVRSHALEKTDGRETFATRRRDIRIEGITNSAASRLSIAPGGFQCRTGAAMLPDASGSVQGLLQQCRKSLTDGERQKLYRVFDALLFHAASTDAASLRDAAEGVLGADRLARLEKDFSNRHYRKWVYPSAQGQSGGQPAFTSLFAALTSERRVLRKDMGELACAEAAARIAKENPTVHLWIANHDQGLQQTAGQVRLAPHVTRQHRDVQCMLQAEDLTVQRLPEAIQLVPTGVLMDVVSRLTGEPYDLPLPERRKLGMGQPFSWERSPMLSVIGF
jgi:hypothetical protein